MSSDHAVAVRAADLITHGCETNISKAIHMAFEFKEVSVKRVTNVLDQVKKIMRSTPVKRNPRRYRRNTGMPAFKVHLADGTDYVTSMAKGITLADAKKYFLGQYLDRGSHNKEKMVKVVKVEQVRENPRRRRYGKKRKSSRARRRNGICRSSLRAFQRGKRSKR